MNYVKTKIAEKLYGKRVVEKVRNHEISLMEGIEQQYPYIHHTLPEQNMTEQQKKNHLKKIQKLSNWLDNALPGSPIPVGLDSLLGFIPVFGGPVGALFSLYQIYLSTYFGIPLWLILRMLLNILVDFLFSFIPIVGGFLHLLYKANVYNYEGLRDWLDDPKHPATRATTEASSTKYHPGTITWTQLGKDTASYVYSKKDIAIPSKLKHS